MINVEEHLGLVYSICKKYKNSTLGYDDAVGYGMLGLVKAAKNFDETLGYKFSTYATLRIRGEICQAIRDKAGLIGSRKEKSEGRARVAIPFSLLITEGEDEDKDMMFEIPTDDTFVDNIAVTSDIRTAISKLPKSEKEIIFKRFWEEKSQASISKELGISQAGISRRLRKALSSISADIGIGGIAN
ncbi:sigma-70 family RNA polymerase sigma factor [Clostridium paraputrificum]|uniref:sigma-70 family RNA polymerase sigma factor n=1 Tax=Clostridium paraputrificum TaxID=29363 RepID=UPI00164DE67B|nr:sigma-70 family RNA polymerase sigma factor [Clostridium paraputrificum]